MRTPQTRFLPFRFAFLTLFVLFSLHHAEAQTPTRAGQQPESRVVFETFPAQAAATVKSAEARCGGFIEYAPRDYRLEVVGAEQEQEQRIYSQGDYVFINAGTDLSLRLGQEFAVIRPRGQFKSKFSRKNGFLGVYTQEVARLKLTEVRERTSVAIITTSCQSVLIGDQLRGSYSAVAPTLRPEAQLAQFIDPETGKQQGRIVLARDGREALSRSQVVFIDLGAEDNVKAGDFLTIYRFIGKGNVSRFRETEIANSSSEGFESDVFRGGKYSNQAQRAKHPNETGVFGAPTVKTPKTRDRRPSLPRKVVGEIVITDVQRRTATAVITRIAQEIHTGDYVIAQ